MVEEGCGGDGEERRREEREGEREGVREEEREWEEWSRASTAARRLPSIRSPAQRGGKACERRIHVYSGMKEEA